VTVSQVADAPSMADGLQQLRSRYGDMVPLADLGGIVADLLASLRDDVSSHELRLYAELEALVRYIEQAKSEIRAIRCDDIPAKHIPLASGELDAIVSHLENATGAILDSCEALEEVGRTVGGEPEAKIGNIVTGIYEACSFQDITGQRTTKIIQSLQTIEQRIVRLIKVLGHEIHGNRSEDAPAGAPRDAHLLNGPQLSQSANSQADIDALFAGLG
jgi:chemotaxis protein CheZ